MNQQPQSGPEPVGPPPPGDPQPEPTQPLPPEPTLPVPVEPVPVEPTQPLPPMQPPQPIPAPPSGPQPVNPAMGSYASGPPQPGYPGAAMPNEPYGGQQYSGQPSPNQPYPGSAAGAYQGQPYAGQGYPGQPNAGQGYPGQPYAGAPYPGQQVPGQAYPGPTGGPQPPYGSPPRRGGKGPLIIIASIVGVLVLGLVAVFALGGLNRTPGAQPSTGSSTGPATASVPPPQPADAAAAVQGYLDALAQGDAETALAYAAIPPEDVSLLTREVLAASLQRAPISDIRVDKATGTGSVETIAASYRVGDRVVDASFPVVKTGADWRLGTVASEVDVSSVATDQIPLSLNGAPLSGSSLSLFPGSYLVVANDSRYAVSKGRFLVESPAAAPNTTSMRLTLSSNGVSKVRSAAQKKLDSCLRARSLAPKGCGFSTYLPGNNKPRNSSIRWRVTKNAGAMRKIKPQADAGYPAMVRANVNVQVKVNLSSTNGRRWYGYSAIYQVQGDLSGKKVVVVFGG